MKKQLLIAAVAASITAVSVADIRIAGSATAGNAGGVTTMEGDLNVTGTSGDTAIVADIALDGGIAVEQLYVTSSVAGVALKAGTWDSGASELGQDGSDTGYSVSTSFGGMNLGYTDKNAGGNTVAISGDFSGISLSHEISDGASETTASGSMGGVTVSAHQIDDDTAGTSTSITLTTTVNDMSFTYVDVSSDGGVSMDGYIGDYANGDIISASAFGISTDVAGNTLELKKVDVTTTGAANDVDQTEITLTRDLGNGATLEASYNDTDNEIGLELSVDF